ncbi:NAD+ synthase [archaeon]|nr:NAD+ synthase [archaeon]
MHEQLVQKIKTYFSSKGFEKAVIGLSGGLDSSVVCFLLVEALGKENVLAYSLPYYEEDSDVQAVVSATGVTLETFSIKCHVDRLCDELSILDKVDKGNIMARTRMTMLYYFARKHGALVVGTGNKTEWLLGYFTKHGDIACDVLPIGSLYKTQVKSLACELGVPEHVIEKSPTASFWVGQTDEQELGFSYTEIDARLKSGGNGLKARMNETEHKRKGSDVL